MISLWRFRFIHNCIRFDDKLNPLEHLKGDKLVTMRDIFSAFVENYKLCYSIGKNVTIHECYLDLEENVGFDNIFHPSPVNTVILKFFAMVYSKVFYTGNFEIYASKQPEDLYLISNKPADVIKRPSEPICSSEHNITADNWFTDTNLFSDF